MARWNVVMTAPVLAAPAVAVLERAGCTIHYMPPYPSADAVTALVGHVQADGILTRQGPVTAAAMAASPRLRVVARHGVGVDDVDLAAAAACGVVVTRAPGSNTRAVAEHTLAMILALAKELGPLSAAVGGGAWRGAATKVRDVAGLRLGLLGFGPIGQAVAPLAAAFGMAVTAYSPRMAPADFTAASAGAAARATTLPALFAGSDVLSLHCPMLPATRHIVDAAALAAMPAGGFVVNTSRGGLIDEAALLGALESGHVAGAGLDVFETEPPLAGDPLRRHPRVIATPHVAGVTDGSLVAMGVMAAECISAVLTGATIPAGRVVVPPGRPLRG
jgi:D-3-phosphoglycerate dehydrogenase